MPSIHKAELIRGLTDHVRAALLRADGNGDDHVDGEERADLPSDVRGLADSTADRYLGGGPLPIEPYVDAYRNFVARSADDADRGDGLVDPSALPAPIYRSVAAMRAGSPRQPRRSASGTVEAVFSRHASRGFSDDAIMEMIGAANRSGGVRAHSEKIIHAVLNPTAGDAGHSGRRFFEALAWYTDATTSGRQDGILIKSELEGAILNGAQKYLDIALGDPSNKSGRLQAWKNIQKLRMLEKTIGEHEGYTYRPREMMAIDSSTPWNRENTIDSAGEFQQRVLEASYDKPVLVKYGLTYCMHCLLLEQLGSVPAVDAKYGDDLDVYKLWWNPNDPAMREITDVARQQGVESSPFFIVYENGEPVRSGYAFPDENGDGMEDLLQGIVREP